MNNNKYMTENKRRSQQQEEEPEEEEFWGRRIECESRGARHTGRLRLGFRSAVRPRITRVVCPGLVLVVGGASLYNLLFFVFCLSKKRMKSNLKNERENVHSFPDY